MSNTTNSGLNMSTTQNTKIDVSVVPPILQFSFGVIGNVIALSILVASSKRHKWKPFYRLVGGLATTDLLGVLFVYPAAFVRYGSDFTYNFPPALCGYVSFIFSFAFMSSAFIVCAMSLDRYLAVIHPFVYNTGSSVCRTNIMLISIWLFTSIVCVLNLIGLGTAKVYFPGSWCFLNFVSRNIKDRINTYIYSVLGVIILLITITLNTIVIVHIIRTSCDKKLKIRRGRQNDVFIIVLLLVIVTVFSICWTPLMVRMLINASIENPQNGPAELLAVRLTITNGIVDPWIYILLRKENLSTMLGLVSRLRSSNNESSTTSHTNTRTIHSIDDATESRDNNPSRVVEART